MRITSFNDFLRQRDNGARFRLNSSGQLETMGSIRYFFQKVGDAFRSLSAAGQAAIRAREQAVQAAMDDLLRQNSAVNPSRGEMPRPSGPLPEAPLRAAAAAAGNVSSQPGVPVKEDARLAAEVFDMATGLVQSRFPDKDAAASFELVQVVCEKVRSMLDSLRPTEDNFGVRLKKAVEDQVAALSGLERTASGVEETPRSASLHRTRTLDARSLRADTLLTQGQNTCFMISVINSMLTSEMGRRILANNLTPDGRLEMGGLSLRHMEGNNPSFSPLEHSLGAAYREYGGESWSEGQLGDAVPVAQMFGLTTESQNLVGDWSAENIRGFLDAGRMVILHAGVHYMAVTGLEGDRLVVRDSLDMGYERYVALNDVQNEHLQVFSYPES